MVKVLVVEDEASIREMIALNLRLAGMEAVEADSAEAALPLLEQRPGCDAAILDVMLPGMNGFSLCETIRRTDQKIGIIILSAKGQEQDKIRGLSIGADDYMTKPFSVSELLARVEALCRRVGRSASTAAGEQAPVSLVSGSFVLDENRRVLLKAGKPIELTQVEFQIMELFFRNPGVALVRERILKGVWGENYFGDVKIVDVNIRRLRMKVEDEPSHPAHILTVWGYGYRGRSKDGKGENAMRSGITRRWLQGSLLITVLLVLLVEVMFLYSTTRSYYNGVQQTMYRRFSSITGQLKMYTGETSQKTAASRSVALRRMVEQFSDKDKYEFMLLDSYGGVIASSSGTDAEGIVTSTDFEQAQEAMDGQGVAIYRTQSGEMVMAACCLVPYAAEDVAAMRLVTSLTLVGQQLKRTAVVALIMGTAVLAFTIMSGLYFVRSIVVPLGQVERTAASIARGELDVRLPVTGDERDEVDRLRGTINRMAEGLEETEKMKNEFISSVSHELRTPLTSIRGWVETLRTLDDPSDENYRKGLEIINNETARLYNMVEELLDFSRLQNGRLKMTCRPLDLVAELTDAVLFCEARIQREGLVLVYNEPEEMIPVYADPDRLRQVFINIMDNAIKYSAPGGRITVKLWAGEYKAFVEILDQGRGIPPEDLENVKTKFYKGSNSVRGSGIGLALVDSIMTALDGTMDIKSTLGRGTVVTLGLPLYKK